MSNNSSLNDEIEALNSIYGDSTLTITSDDASNTSAILQLPSQPFSFLLSFPPTYPDTAPTIDGTSSTGNTHRGSASAALAILRSTLGRVYTAGTVCLFDLVEEVGSLLGADDDGSDGAAEDQDAPARSAAPPSPHEYVDENLTRAPASSAIPPPPRPPWALSEPLTASKSSFVARACRVASLHDATDSISHLLATNKKVAGATHNITAWRIRGEHEATIQDCDDDGETAAGGRLLHLMQLMDVWDVVVVVTRWYGGVKLGPDRFRLINQVAREALVKGGFVREEPEKGKAAAKGKGRK